MIEKSTLLMVLAAFGFLASGPADAGTRFNGTFARALSADPPSLNVVTTLEAGAGLVFDYAIESLLNRDDDTYDWLPCLATQWTISKDGTVFTFTLRDGVKWSDGQPLTAEDVKYSFDIYFEGRFNAPAMKQGLEAIKEVKILDSKTVQFTTKDIYFMNFDQVATLPIIPKHFYGVGDPKDPKFNKVLIGTGPYVLDSWEKGQRITLKRNPNYWGNEVPYYKDRYHFEKLLFRVVKEEAVSLELVKKGDIDFDALTAEQYVTKTKGPEWGTKVVAVKTENSMPQNYTYGYVAWNELNPLFKDKRVRKALAMLVDRDTMIQKFLYGMSEKAVGPFGNKSPSSNPAVKPIPYDPKGALKLLGEVGWKLGSGGLTKTVDGKETKFEFSLLNPNADFEKYLTVIKEDMKKVGITMNLRLVEWNSFLKLVDERKFDALVMAWQVNSLENDNKQIFHSESIKNQGSNFISYSNPEVDKLIDEIRRTMAAQKRRKLFWKLHSLIADDAPYAFLFNAKYILYARGMRIHAPQDTLKFKVGTDTWSLP